MKKVFISLFVLAAVSFGMAHSFTVGAAYTEGLAVTAEYGYPVDRLGEVLVGVSVIPFTWDSEVSLGARAQVFTVDTVDFAVALRAHMPFMADGEWVLGQVRGSLTLDALIRQEHNNFSMVPFVGVSAPLTSEGLTSWPSLVFGVGLRWETAPLSQFSLFNR